MSLNLKVKSTKILIGLALAVILGGYFVFFYQTCSEVFPPSMGSYDPNIVERDGKLYFCATLFQKLKNGGLFSLGNTDITPIEDQEISPPSQPDTTSWKTYRNEEYGFEVRYPPDVHLELEGSNEGSGPVQSGTNPLLFETVIFSRPAAEEPILTIQVGQKVQSLEETGLECETQFGDLKETRSLRFLGREAESRIIDFSRWGGTTGEDVCVIGPAGNIISFEMAYPRTDLASQVFSTFRFISEFNTSNWKTYRNEEYGFAIKYPPDWQLILKPNQKSRWDNTLDAGLEIQLWSPDDYRNRTETAYDSPSVAVSPFPNTSKLSFRQWYNTNIESKLPALSKFSAEISDLYLEHGIVAYSVETAVARPADLYIPVPKGYFLEVVPRDSFDGEFYPQEREILESFILLP